MATRILADRYNQIQSKIQSILGTPADQTPTVGYGQNVKSSQVFTGSSKISVTDYTNLIDDLSRARYHQIGSAFTGIDPPVPQSKNREKVFETYIENLENLIQDIQDDVEIADTSQFIESNLQQSNGIVVTSSLSQPWKKLTSYTFDVEFSSVAHYRSFFNTGSELRFLTSLTYTGTEEKSLAWQTALTNLSTVRFSKNQTTAVNGSVISQIGAKDLLIGNTVTIIEVSNFSTPYSLNSIKIEATNLNNRVLRFIITLNDPLTSDTATRETVKGTISTSIRVFRTAGSLSKIQISSPIGLNIDPYKIFLYPVTYEIIGGGGGGGAGRDDDGSAGFGLYSESGGTSLIVVDEEAVVTAAGGSGGFSFAYLWNDPRGAGQASVYGPGGARAGVNRPGNNAPATSYGAGGGGGGGDQPQIFDSSGNGGEGGYAGVYQTGTIEVFPESTISVVIGNGGIGHKVGYIGGNGASGYAKLTVEGQTYEFTANGSIDLV